MLLNCGVREDSWESLGLQGDQSILKEISPGCSLEGLMLNLKLQYFGHLKGRSDSFEKTLMWERLRAGGEGDDRGWDGWMASATQWTWVWMDYRSWWWTGSPGVVWFIGPQRVRHNWATEVNWTNSVKWIDFYPGIYYHATIMSIWTGEVQRYVYVNFYIVFPST